MSNVSYLKILINQIIKAGKSEKDVAYELANLRQTLGNYELSNIGRDEIEAIIEYNLKHHGGKSLEKVVEHTGETLRKLRSMPVEEYGREVIEEAREITGDAEARLTELLLSLQRPPEELSDIDSALLPEARAQIADVMHDAMEDKGNITAIDWAENVSDFTDDCEASGGIPMFRTKYGGQRFKDFDSPGKYLVLGVCYSKGWSQWFENVDFGDIRQLEREE